MKRIGYFTLSHPRDCSRRPGRLKVMALLERPRDATLPIRNTLPLGYFQNEGEAK